MQDFITLQLIKESMMKTLAMTTMRQQITYVWLLIAFVLGSCDIAEGDEGMAPGNDSGYMPPATYLCQWDDEGAGNSTVTLSGNTLVIGNPPVTYWASLAGYHCKTTAGKAHTLCFQLTHVGFSSQSSLYSLSSEPYDGYGAPYAVGVTAAGDDGQLHQMTLSVGADSRLLVNGYNGTMALYLHLLALSVDGEIVTRFGADGLLMVLRSTGYNHD